LESRPPSRNLVSLVHQIRNIERAEFARRFLLGILHDAGLAADLISGKISPADAVAGSSAEKREWLAYIGVFPHAPDRPSCRLLEFLVSSPGEIQEHAARVIEEFWYGAFAPAWGRLLPDFHRSLESSERLFHSSSLGEFAASLRLAVEVDDERRELRALRGGFRIALAALETIYVIPSAFNFRRFWTVVPSPDGKPVAVFPYFDHTLEIKFIPEAADTAGAAATAAAADPALICKAVGDATRMSMLGLLTRRQQTSSQLATALGLSKPTISHHLFQLRQAGLIEERVLGRAVELGVNRQTLEDLSGQLIRHFYGNSPGLTPVT
jgi:DNA-binding transcriptional ArsR family regulator